MKLTSYEMDFKSLSELPKDMLIKLLLTLGKTVREETEKAYEIRIKKILREEPELRRIYCGLCNEFNIAFRDETYKSNGCNILTCTMCYFRSCDKHEYIKMIKNVPCSSCHNNIHITFLYKKCLLDPIICCVCSLE